MAQDSNLEIKDSIVARYNRQNYKGIYRLADTSFTKKISEQQLTRFLAGNFSTGKILSSQLQLSTTTTKEYLMHGQARDFVLVLGVNAQKRFTDFGFKPVVTTLKPLAAVKSNNPMATKQDRQIDSIAKEYFRFPTAAGLSIGIILNGKTFTYHYGQPDKTKPALPDNNTGYQLASVSKTFTATLLAQAVLDGKVNLDDDIRKYLPGTYPNLEYKGQGITFKNLANHTGGLPTILPNEQEQAGFDPLSPTLHYTEAMFYDALHALQLQKAPGTEFVYSNMGMSLVGLILEKVYHKSYNDLLKEYITGPLSMTRTSVILNTDLEKSMAIPYSNNGDIMPLWTDDINQPAGGISSTMGDMLKYLQAQISESDAAILLTHQPTANSTGLGWGVRSVNGKRDMQHNGGGIGFRSNVTVYPDKKSGLVILVNNDSDTNIMNSLVVAVQRLVLAAP